VGVFIFPVMREALGEVAHSTGAAVSDAARANFGCEQWINPTPLILQPVPPVTPTTGLTTWMVTNLQTLLAKAEQATAKIEAASKALNSYLSAVADNGPGYQDMHLDEYDQFSAGAQIALGKIADITATMGDASIWKKGMGDASIWKKGMGDASIWKKGNVDLRPILAPLYQATANLRAWSLADLETQP